MKRIIIIDGCSANIIFPSAHTAMPLSTTTMPGGRLQRSAIALSRAGRPVTMMGEAGRDPLGDLIVGHLSSQGIDTVCIDRYSDEAVTPSILIFPAPEADRPIRSTVYPVNMAEQWDSTWPRVEASDIVVFGGYFSLQNRVRTRLTEFLTYVRERGALTVYLPGFNPALSQAVTRFMPALLENLELADAVVTSSPDLHHLFAIDDPEAAFSRKISFYSPLMVNFDPSTARLTVHHANTTLSLEAPALNDTPSAPVLSCLPLAATVSALSEYNIAPQMLQALQTPTLNAIAAMIASCSLSSNIVNL